MDVKRYPNNPIVGPDRSHAWEAQAAFNGSPIKDDGTYHLLYRALSYEQAHEGMRMEVSTVGHVTSDDGINFNNERTQLIAPQEEWEKFGCEDPRVTKIDDTFYITYTALSDYPHSADGIKVAVATTKDFKTIQQRHLVTPFNAKAASLFSDRIDGKIVMILTMNTDRPPVRIVIATFDNVEQMWDPAYWAEWEKDIDRHTLHFQRTLSDHIEVGAAPVKTDEGWLLVYSYIRNYPSAHKTFGIEAALLDLKNPLHVIGRTARPLMVPAEHYEFHGMIDNIIFPSGALLEGERFRIYYGAADTSCCVAEIPLTSLLNEIRQKSCADYAGQEAPAILERFEGNPIIEPNTNNPFESRYTLNPTAIDDDGKVHILYRAQDNDDTSTIGLAISTDGLRLDKKYDHPIYLPRVWNEVREEPGNSGCEDARITKLGDRFYMCYTAYNGYANARVAFTSISEQDFRNQKWSAWELPQIISPENEYDKNACLVSEKIKGEYMFFHRLRTHIWVDTVPNLDFEDGRLLGGNILMSPREDTWDSLKIGIAGPPIKLEDGTWVLIYHSLSKHDGQYRLGAALLDLENQNVLARLPYPILAPEAPYENNGLRPGTVFSCGQVVRDDTLFVYYGGADQVVCTATMDFSCLVDALREHRK